MAFDNSTISTKNLLSNTFSTNLSNKARVGNFEKHMFLKIQGKDVTSLVLFAQHLVGTTPP